MCRGIGSIDEESRKNGARVIPESYKADPVTWPKCNGRRRIVSFLEDEEVLQKTVRHLGQRGYQTLRLVHSLVGTSFVMRLPPFFPCAYFAGGGPLGSESGTP